MSIMNQHLPGERGSLAITLWFCTAGFVTGFVLSLVVATYSLYVCVAAY